MRLVGTLAALAALALAAVPGHATTFTDGEFVTWSQVAWGDTPAPGNISFSLEQNFDSLFAPSELLEVGVPGPAGFSLIFDSPDAIITYLPASGAPGLLTADLDDPVSSASGSLGGEVVAATLNVLFSANGLLAHPAGVPFGDLVLQNLGSLAGVGPEVAQLDGMSVQEVLADANTLLGGATSPFTPLDMFIVLNDIDMAFNGGPVSTVRDGASRVSLDDADGPGAVDLGDDARRLRRPRRRPLSGVARPRRRSTLRRVASKPRRVGTLLCPCRFC